jgi:hypothetical protein
MESLQQSFANEGSSLGEHEVLIEGSPNCPPPPGHGWTYDPGNRRWFVVKHTSWGLWDRPLW